MRHAEAFRRFMASRYAESAGRAEEAISWLKTGMEACPGR
jgi:hypothetical protein